MRPVHVPAHGTYRCPLCEETIESTAAPPGIAVPPLSSQESNFRRRSPKTQLSCAAIVGIATSCALLIIGLAVAWLNLGPPRSTAPRSSPQVKRRQNNHQKTASASQSPRDSSRASGRIVKHWSERDASSITVHAVVRNDGPPATFMIEAEVREGVHVPPKRVRWLALKTGQEKSLAVNLVDLDNSDGRYQVSISRFGEYDENAIEPIPSPANAPEGRRPYSTLDQVGQ